MGVRFFLSEAPVEHSDPRPFGSETTSEEEDKDPKHLVWRRVLQGYLAHKKHPFRRTLQSTYA